MTVVDLPGYAEFFAEVANMGFFCPVAAMAKRLLAAVIL